MSFFVSKNGRDKQGPLSLQSMSKLISEESLLREDLVWRDGLDDWVAADKLPELQKIFNSQPPPLNRTKQRSSHLRGQRRRHSHQQRDDDKVGGAKPRRIDLKVIVTKRIFCRPELEYLDFRTTKTEN